MSGAPKLSVRAIETFEWPYAFRMPFRFGAITVTQGRQAVVRVRIALADGREAVGMAAEALAAKWFDKNPALSDDDNFEQLRSALANASDAYLAHGADTAFGRFAANYEPLMTQGARQELPPLVVSYGPALLDRAVADALGRALGISFADLARGNVLGIAPAVLAPDLAGFDADGFLARLVPLERLHVRHTVGMVDPITAADVAAPLDDGLPETLAEVVATNGHRYFKLKVGGDVAADIARLSRVAAVLDAIDAPYHVSLDGNEQYADAPAVLELLRAIEATPGLGRLRKSLLYIEQPIRRSDALARSVDALDAFAPVLLDESDGAIDVFPRGKALGYRGVSSKTCKGFYKSLINRMRCAAWGDHRYFMSAEDLTHVAGLAVQQDLALVALLGLTHVERNGHHFVDGFTGRPAAEAEAFLAAHPDLYRRHAGRVRLRIADGQVAIGSLACPGFGSAMHPDFSAMEPGRALGSGAAGDTGRQ
jgi:L-alanine-DL-glutamate epimerase-like enolase superfamily enzyme